MKRIICLLSIAIILMPAMAAASWFTDCRDQRPLGETCTQAQIGINACCNRLYKASKNITLYFGCIQDNATAFVDCEPPAERSLSSYLTNEERDALILALVGGELQKAALENLLGKAEK